jgi:phage shock protein C
VAKRLYRSSSDKVIAGVCGGLGEYFDIDPIIWRIVFIFLLMPGGFPGFIPYLILWAIIPEKGKVHTNGKER